MLEAPAVTAEKNLMARELVENDRILPADLFPIGRNLFTYVGDLPRDRIRRSLPLA